MTSPKAIDDPRPVPKILQGGTPRLTSQTRVLLHSRLILGFALVFLAFVIFLPRGFFLTLPLSLRIFHTTVTFSLGSCLIFLVACKTLPIIRLRIIETTLFLLVVVFLGVAARTLLYQAGTERDPLLAMSAIKGSILYSLLIMMGYSMIIPNTWRRSLVMVSVLALMPIVVALEIRYSHPEFKELCEQVATIEQILENVLILVLGAISAVFGTYVINSLRKEAFEAKQVGLYHLRKKIGSGGMGEVYLAEHEFLKRPCVVKIINPELAGNAQVVARFEREVQATARLSHWNTVEIYDYGRTETGSFFYVMEYLSGANLEEIVERFGPLSPERAVFLMTQVCDALAEAEALGMIHRDLKPSNIFACEVGQKYDVVKVLDF